MAMTLDARVFITAFSSTIMTWVFTGAFMLMIAFVGSIFTGHVSAIIYTFAMKFALTFGIYALPSPPTVIGQAHGATDVGLTRLRVVTLAMVRRSYTSKGMPSTFGVAVVTIVYGYAGAPVIIAGTDLIRGACIVVTKQVDVITVVVWAAVTGVVGVGVARESPRACRGADFFTTVVGPAS